MRRASRKLLLHNGVRSLYTFYCGAGERERLPRDEHTDKGHPARKPGAQSRWPKRRPRKGPRARTQRSPKWCHREKKNQKAGGALRDRRRAPAFTPSRHAKSIARPRLTVAPHGSSRVNLKATGITSRTS